MSLITAILLNLKKDKIKEYGVESAFAVLMIVTASAMAFAHGSNDVANAIGPMSAIISVASEGAIGAKAAVSPWVYSNRRNWYCFWIGNARWKSY